MTSVSASTDQVGRAYGRPQPSPDEALVRCGPGTLGGELLRRYWQPVALAADATELPKLIKIFDEELILYRDKSGTPGLLYPRCMHRGANLLFGKVETNGLRCCYHGWLFDEEGHCLETPCEPDRRAPQHIRQPWYPLIERFGLIFTYMGPPDRQPLFPRFAFEEDLGEDEELVAYWRDSGPNGGGVDGVPPKLAAWSDYNWWQMFDNFMDAFHVAVLHTTINGYQFEESLGILPAVKFEMTSDGVRSIQHRKLADGRMHQRVSQVILPNMNCTAGVTDDDLDRSGIGWTIAIDDTHYRTFGVSRIRRHRNTPGVPPNLGLMQDDWGPAHKLPMREWSVEDHQHWQTDYIAQKSQGDISYHSEEHLSRIDKGTSMMRRLFKQQAQGVAKGSDPIGVSFDKPYFVAMFGGNAILDEASMECIAGFDGRSGLTAEAPSSALLP